MNYSEQLQQLQTVLYSECDVVLKWEGTVTSKLPSQPVRKIGQQPAQKGWLCR